MTAAAAPTADSRTNRRKLLLASLVGALAIFLVNSIGWNVLPLTHRAIADLDDPRLVELLAAATQMQPGTYFVNPNEHRDGLGPGPIYGWTTLWQREDYSVPSMLAGSLLHNLGTALLMGYVLQRLRTSRRERAAAALAIAGIATLAGPVWDWLWAFYSPAFAIAVGVNTLLGYALAAWTIAKLVRTADQPHSSAGVPQFTSTRSSEQPGALM